MMRRIADTLAATLLIGALLWAVGLVMGAWLIVVSLVAIYAALRTLHVWPGLAWQGILRLRRLANVLFGERYDDDLQALGDDAMSILEAARNIHNWGSRNAAAVAGLATVVGLWLAPEHWEPFVGLAGLVCIVGATHFPAIRRRIEEWSP